MNSKTETMKHGRREAHPYCPYDFERHHPCPTALWANGRFDIPQCPSFYIHFVTATGQSGRLEEGCSSARRAPSSYNDCSSSPQQSAGYGY